MTDAMSADELHKLAENRKKFEESQVTNANRLHEMFKHFRPISCPVDTFLSPNGIENIYDPAKRLPYGLLLTLTLSQDKNKSFSPEFLQNAFYQACCKKPKSEKKDEISIFCIECLENFEHYEIWCVPTESFKVWLRKKEKGQPPVDKVNTIQGFLEWLVRPEDDQFINGFLLEIPKDGDAKPHCFDEIQSFITDVTFHGFAGPSVFFPKDKAQAQVGPAAARRGRAMEQASDKKDLDAIFEVSSRLRVASGKAASKRDEDRCLQARLESPSNGLFGIKDPDPELVRELLENLLQERRQSCDATDQLLCYLAELRLAMTDRDMLRAPLSDASREWQKQRGLEALAKRRLVGPESQDTLARALFDLPFDPLTGMIVYPRVFEEVKGIVHCMALRVIDPQTATLPLTPASVDDFIETVLQLKLSVDSGDFNEPVSGESDTCDEGLASKHTLVFLHNTLKLIFASKENINNEDLLRCIHTYLAMCTKAEVYPFACEPLVFSLLMKSEIVTSSESKKETKKRRRQDQLEETEEDDGQDALIREAASAYLDRSQSVLGTVRRVWIMPADLERKIQAYLAKK